MTRTSTAAILFGLFAFIMTGCGGSSGNAGEQQSNSHEHAQHEHGDHHEGEHDHQHEGDEHGKDHDMKDVQSSGDTLTLKKVSDAARGAMTEATDRYFALKGAFVKTDAKAASEEAQKLLAALDNKELQSLSGRQQSFYQTRSKKVSKALKTIEGSSDVEQQRQAFETVSNNMYELIKGFGAGNGKVYRQYCPMAFDNEGAHWLSNAEQIRNPYFGDKMLKCGKVTETL